MKENQQALADELSPANAIVLMRGITPLRVTTAAHSMSSFALDDMVLERVVMPCQFVQ